MAGPNLMYPSWWKRNLWGHSQYVVKRNKLHLSSLEQKQLTQVHGKAKKIFLKRIKAEIPFR